MVKKESFVIANAVKKCLRGSCSIKFQSRGKSLTNQKLKGKANCNKLQAYKDLQYSI